MIIIGIGSNVGARESMLDAALEYLSAHLDAMHTSRRYETPALLLPGSPPEWNMPFLNMAASGMCDLPPEELLAALKKIEAQMGRIDRGRWAPREIDLDILAYHDLEITTPSLTIPHAELLNRHFTLAPLADVAPNWYYRGKTAAQWLEEKFPA